MILPLGFSPADPPHYDIWVTCTSRSMQMLSNMTSCGMYDASGQFLYGEDQYEQATCECLKFLQ